MSLINRLKQTATIFAALSCFTFGLAVTSHATEAGGGTYANGIEGFAAGMLPPPGTYFLNYVNIYSARDFENSLLPSDFKLDVAANVFRVVHMTNQKVFGGSWGMQVILPLIYMDATMAGRNQSNTGFGDMVIDPILLAYHSRNLHYAFGLDVVLPTGEYNKNDLANPGRNYWTFEPVFAATYLNNDGCEASIKLMYDVNTRNRDTDYRSGQEFHADYTLAKQFNALSAGIGGYIYKQITGDSGSGAILGDFKGRAFAIGPQLKYNYKNMAFSAKYQHEMLVENKPEGDKLWFNLMYAF